MPLNLIPQIFFDIIARIIPGSLLIIGGIITALGPTKSMTGLLGLRENSALLSFWPIVAAITLSYALGFILSELQKITLGKIKKSAKPGGDESLNRKQKIIDRHRKVRKSLFGVDVPISASDLPPTYVMHDHLRQEPNTEAYRLLKLRAEERLCNVLALVLIMLAALNIIVLAIDQTDISFERIILEIGYLLSAWLLLRRGETLGRYYNDGTLRSWLIQFFPLKSPEEKNITDTTC